MSIWILKGIVILYALLSLSSGSERIVSLEENGKVNEAREVFVHETDKYKTGNSSWNVINRCHCPSDTVLVGSECKEKKNLTIEVLTDPIHYGHKFINLSKFKTTTKALICPQHTKYLILEEPDFFLTENNALKYKHLLFHSVDYCVEYVDKEGVEAWIAQVCIHPPLLRSCCSSGYHFNASTSECTAHMNGIHLSDYHTALPLNVTNTDIGYDIVSNDALLTCDRNQTRLVLVPLEGSNSSGKLHYDVSGIELDALHDDLTFIKHYKQDEFCVTNTQEGFAAVVCYSNPHETHDKICSNHKTCIRKCCKENQAIDSVRSQCVDVQDEALLYAPVIYDSYYYETPSEEFNVSHVRFTYGTPLCYDPYEINDNFHILDDGSAYVSTDHTQVTSEYYCVDNKLGYNGTKTRTLYFCDTSTKCEKLKTPVTRILMGISILFLVLTLLVCKIVPELHVYISGKNLVTHVFSLLLAFVFSMVVHVGNLQEFNLTVCRIAACLVQFFFLATFFWLNAMCFELWYPSRFRPTRTNSASETRFKYKLHSVYGWGTPSLVVAVTLIVDLAVPSNVTSSMVPHFGYPHCWFRDNPSSWLYFNGIILTLCATNVFFFVDMAKIYIKQCMDSAFIHLSRQIYAERVVLYLKLFSVMGVTWIFEQISEAAEHTACSTWITFDVINLLRGPCIFLSVISTKTVIKKIRSRTAAWFKGSKSTLATHKKAEDLKKLTRKPTPALSGTSDKRVSTSSMNSYQTSDVQTEETSVKTDSSFSTNKENQCMENRNSSTDGIRDLKATVSTDAVSSVETGLVPETSSDHTNLSAKTEVPITSTASNSATSTSATSNTAASSSDTTENAETTPNLPNRSNNNINSTINDNESNSSCHPNDELRSIN